jgi:AcrR family transcriptional regulator
MPKIVDHDLKRALLLTAATRAVARHGLDGASLRVVAREARCTTGTVLHYFRDRQALLVAALRSVNDAAARRMIETASEATTPRSRLEAVVTQALPLDRERTDEWRVWLTFWSSALGNRELARENAARLSDWHQLTEQLLAPLSAKPARDAAHLRALIDGAALTVVLAVDREQAKRARTQALGLIEHWLTRLDAPRRSARN